MAAAEDLKAKALEIHCRRSKSTVASAASLAVRSFTSTRSIR
jgi:hypothetical protein